MAMHQRSYSFRRLTSIAVAVLALSVLFLFGQRDAVSAGSLKFAGTVLTPSGSQYTGGGNLNMWNSEGGWGSNISGDGLFEVTGLNPGTYTVEATVPGDSVYANSTQQQVTVTADVTNFQIRVAVPAVSGTIANPDGTATSGCVNLRTATWTINRGYCSGNDGKFRIGGVDAGEYILSLSSPDNSPYVGNDRPVTVTNPSTTIELGAVKFENPFVVGKVALPDGTLLTWNDDWSQRLHLSVDLWNNDRTIDRHSNFDSQSKFKFGTMPAGTYTIHINIWDTEIYTGSENVTITVPAGGLDMTGSPIRLSTPQLSGVVSDASGAPVQNVWINVHNDDWSVNQGSSTDSNGKYRIGGIPAGAYLMEVNPPQERTDLVRSDPVSVTITSALQTKNITISAAKKFISGKVKRKDGTPVSCAQVNANRRGGNGWAGTQTGSDGSFLLTVQPGSWNIRVERSGDWNCQTADWIFLDPEVVVEFSDSSATETQTANFTVQKATAVIIGKVTKKDGTPITNGNINANSQTQDGRNRWANSQIGSDGRFRINLVGGTYDLNVWTNDQSLFVRNQNVTVADNETVTANFVMGQKLAHIKGKVTDKGGKGLPSMQLNGNLDCGPNGCAAWSNTTTATDGTFDMAATAGHWYINFDSGRGQSYVYDGPQKDIYLDTETSTVSDVNFELTYADVTVKGKVVDESGKPFADFPGWAFLQPLAVTAGAGNREYGGPVNQGTFNFRVPSSIYSQARLGVHTAPNSQYSSPDGQTITLVADATIEKDIVVKKNDAAIVGKITNASGLPLQNCNFRGEIYANAPSAWYGTQVNPDCTYEVSVLAGTYNIGYHFDESAGFLNRPIQNSQVTINPGTRLQYDIPVLAGDVRVSVLLLTPKGEPARRNWINADNHIEIDEQRRAAEDQSQSNEKAFQGPGGTTSPEELFKYCSKPENEKECSEFKLPGGSEGPGGCKDALACTRYCKEHQKECDKEIDRDPVKKQSGRVVSQSVQNRRSKIASLKPAKVKMFAAEQDSDDPFENMINSGSETNDKGVATLTLLSGHCYTFNAGVPPESSYMPPRSQDLCLADTTPASLTLTLRTSDGKMSGFVRWEKTAVQNGWIGCWSEDGNSNGTPIQNGTYSMNYAFDTTYHCEANAFDGTKFLRSGQEIVAINRQKTKRQDFKLDLSTFEIPPPVSECFDATQPHVITLTDGTTVNIPSNTIATSGTVCVTANPTASVQSSSTARPIGLAYSFEAKDENNKVISTFNNDVTVSFNYTQEQLDEAGVKEESLIPSYWDVSSGTWKKPSNLTQKNIADTPKEGTGIITARSSHFTAYAVVSSGGKAGNNMKNVTTSRSKTGITTVKVGSGKSAVRFKPFPTYKGDVSIQTVGVSGKTKQIIVVTQAGSSADATTVKVFSVKGKLLRPSLKPWGGAYRKGAQLMTDELTGDGLQDLVIVPTSGTTVKVQDLKSWKVYSVQAAARASEIVTQTFNLLNRGGQQLVTKAGNSLLTWKFSGNKFVTFIFDARKLKVQGNRIERVYLRPSVSSVSATVLKAGKGLKTLKVKGANLGRGSRVLLNGTIPALRVTAKGETELSVTINLAKLKPKKSYDLKVINADGQQITLSKKLRTK